MKSSVMKRILLFERRTKGLKIKISVWYKIERTKRVKTWIDGQPDKVVRMTPVNNHLININTFQSQENFDLRLNSSVKVPYFSLKSSSLIFFNMIHENVGIVKIVRPPTTPDAYIPKDSPDEFVLTQQKLIAAERIKLMNYCMKNLINRFHIIFYFKYYCNLEIFSEQFLMSVKNKSTIKIKQ